MTVAASTFFWLFACLIHLFSVPLNLLDPYALDVSYKQSIAYFFLKLSVFFLQIWQFIIMDVFLFIVIIDILHLPAVLFVFILFDFVYSF